MHILPDEVVLHRVIEAVVKHGGLSLLSPLNQSGLSLELILLMLGDYGLNFLSLFPVILVLKHEHVCLLNIEIESIFELIGLLGGFFLETCKLSLSLLNDGVDIHETVIAQNLLLLLKDLGSTMNEDLLILFFSKCLL